MPLAPGARLGPYEIESLIGAGGMGEVYRARDSRLGRDVAIKVLRRTVQRGRTLRSEARRSRRSITRTSARSTTSVPTISCSSSSTGDELRGPWIGRSRAPGRADRRRDRGRARPRHPAPRSQAGEHHGSPRDGKIAKLLDFGVARLGRSRSSKRLDRPARASSARRPTCRPSRPKGDRRTRVRTSSASAPCSTRCSPAAGRSRATPSPAFCASSAMSHRR